MGAGSVFLNTDFSRYILADINSDLISLYNIVKLRTDEYVQASRELFMPETNQLRSITNSVRSSTPAVTPFVGRYCFYI